MGFASFLGWLAAFGIFVVGAYRFVSRRRAASGEDDQSLDTQRKAALRRDLAYLTKQAANVRQLKQTAKVTGNQLDKHLEILEWREYVDDAARFIVAARAEGSKEFLNGAARIRTLLQELGLADAEFEKSMLAKNP
ncbi:MAG: hypothetical protein GXY44_11660 [Phycisphaerales bacterium]|nr:hypothetical protein [Phycisphaerales bacterium]